MNPLDVVAKSTPAGWFRPWMIWAAAVAVLLAALGLQTVRLADAQTDLAVAAKEHAEALEKASEEARITEGQLRSDNETLQASLAKEKEVAKSREDALVDAVRSGERRLRIAAVCSSGPGLHPPASGGGGSGLQVAELDPATGERILRIGTDGDNAIRERNACVTAYEAVRKRLNASAAP